LRRIAVTSISYDRSFLSSISHTISERAALLRAKHGLRTPDAIQVATATIRKADYFLTNDPALKKIKDVKVLVLDDYLPGASRGYGAGC
jgi:predicted nucleic acid-binding protein